jgi:hypothetical protein
VQPARRFLIWRAGAMTSVLLLAACGGTGSVPAGTPTPVPPTVSPVRSAPDGSPAASPASLATSEVSSAPGEVRLYGTIVGHADGGVPLEVNEWRTVADASIEVHLRLSPNRALANGTVTISTSTTGDCEFSDQGEADVNWDSSHSEGRSTEGLPWGSVSLYMDDPRYFAPGHALEAVVLSVGAGIHREGGTCGHNIPPVNKPLFSLQGDPFSACEGIELQRNAAGTWEGGCNEVDSTGWEYASIVARFEPE